MEVFKNDEAGYQEWNDANLEGYVFNRFGGTNGAYNVLHRSNCNFLWREIDDGARTAVEKWCSTSQSELEERAESELGPQMWKKCGVCFHASPTEQSRLSHPVIPEISTNLTGFAK